MTFQSSLHGLLKSFDRSEPPPAVKAGFDNPIMKFSVADLLDQLSYDQPVPKATLAKILKLSNKADKDGAGACRFMV